MQTGFKTQQMVVQEKKRQKEIKELKNAVEEDDREDLDMMLAMGLPVGFDSTNDKQVAGNDVGGAHAAPTRKFRQYVRKGNPNLRKLQRNK